MNRPKSNLEQAWLCPHCGANQSGGACGTGLATGQDAASSCGSGCSAGGGCALVVCQQCGGSFPHPSRSGLTYRLSLWLGRRAAARSAASANDNPEEAP